MSATQTAITPDFVTAYREMMASQFFAEFIITRKVLEAVPEDRLDYRPDPKARTALELMRHLAGSDVHMLDDTAKMNYGTSEDDVPHTKREIIEWYAREFPMALNRFRAMTAEQLLTPVDFYGAMKEPVFTYLIISNNHTIHHRGELVTYIRPMGGKVPSVYGGSADEPYGS